MSRLEFQVFYDALSLPKGPSLGTNFTLVCPYALLAHYNELSWAESYGVPRNLIRISVGLEDIQVNIKAIVYTYIYIYMYITVLNCCTFCTLLRY